MVNQPINGRPYGYAYRRPSLDPTNVSRRSRSRCRRPAASLPRLRRITQREFTGYADYHSMQFSVNRRRSSDGLAFGASYTHELVNKTLAGIDPFVDDNRARNYWVTGDNGRRRTTSMFNYSYEVPNVGRALGQPARGCCSRAGRSPASPRC